jgi:lipocalin
MSRITKRFDSIPIFNIKAYLGKWFAMLHNPRFCQQQQEVKYLPISRNFNVVAQYDMIDASNVRVYNSANDRALDGPAAGGELLAIIRDQNALSKLAVGPKWLPNFLRGPYWVMAASPVSMLNNKEQYKWAIITGGEPNYQNSENGLFSCRPNWYQIFGSGEGNWHCSTCLGFWIFTREAHPSEELMDEVLKVAVDLGLDTSVLNKVEHN